MGKLLENVGIKPDISFGNLLSICTMLLSLVTAIWLFSGRVTKIETDLGNEIKIAQEGRSTARPKLEATVAENALQDEKINRLADALEKNQAAVIELTKATNDLRVLVAVLNAKTDVKPEESGVVK